MTLNNLTIVIITYNRYCFLKRLLNFYRAFQTEVKILVLDSSSEILEDEDLIAQLKSDNVVWKRYDEAIFFVEKIAQGSAFINTEYAVICADDDFLFPTSLDKAVHFLQSNKDFSSCLGLQYKHRIRRFLTKKIIMFRQSAIGGIGSNEELSSERVFKYLSGRTVFYPLYAVHTTKNLIRIWQETSKVVSDWGLSEIFPCSVSLCLGKMKVLPMPYTTREPNSFVWYDDLRLREMYTAEKIDIVKNRLGEIISKADGVSVSEGIMLATKAIDIFQQRIFEKKKYGERSETTIQKLKSKISTLPLVGRHISKFNAKIMGLLRFYLINRATPMKCLDYDTKRQLDNALLKSNCSQTEIVNSRKDYA